MAPRSLRCGFHWAAAALAVGLWAGGGFPARAQFFPFFGQPARPRPATQPQPQPRPLTLAQVRAVLAQEGAQLIGRPRQRGQDIVAIGGDDQGNRKRFTLDATTGEVLDVTVLVRREAPPAAPGAGALAPPGAPLSAPQHGPDGSAAPVRGHDRSGFAAGLVQLRRGIRRQLRRFGAQPDPAAASAGGAQGRAPAAIRAKKIGRLKQAPDRSHTERNYAAFCDSTGRGAPCSIGMARGRCASGISRTRST